MPRRAFMPPARCQRCGEQPPLGETLIHFDDWLCSTCLAKASPGKDSTTKAAFFAGIAQFNRALGMRCEAGGQEESARDYDRIDRWQAYAADLLKQAGNNRARAAQVFLGELAPNEPGFLQATLTTPDLAALDASGDRLRLLTADGVDAVALALDAVHSAGCKSSLEKMHVHQLAVLHKTALEQFHRASYTTDPALQSKQFQTANRLVRNFQHGLIALMRLRGGGNPIIQHVHLGEGAQAVVGAVQNGKG